MQGTEEASNGGKVKVHIIHGLNISQKNSYTYCKNLQVIKNQELRACSQGNRLVGKDHRSSPTATHKEDNLRTPHVSNLLHNVYHTCMLRDLQTSTQVFLKFTTTQLAQHLYHYLHISKQSSSIKLLLVFNALYMKVFIISLLDAYHIRTNFIAK